MWLAAAASNPAGGWSCNCSPLHLAESNQSEDESQDPVCLGRRAESLLTTIAIVPFSSAS